MRPKSHGAIRRSTHPLNGYLVAARTAVVPGRVRPLGLSAAHKADEELAARQPSVDRPGLCLFLPLHADVLEEAALADVGELVAVSVKVVVGWSVVHGLRG
jgi:hypothetical protein